MGLRGAFRLSLGKCADEPVNHSLIPGTRCQGAAEAGFPRRMDACEFTKERPAGRDVDLRTLCLKSLSLI